MGCVSPNPSRRESGAKTELPKSHSIDNPEKEQPISGKSKGSFESSSKNSKKQE